MTKIVIHSDGSRTAGAAVAYDLTGVKLAERARVVVDGTVPICEYTGLIVGMRLARDLGATEVECWMDAELVARHATGEYACRDAKLKPYLAQVRSLQAEFEAAEIRLFPKAGPRMKRRHMNVEADALAAECSRLGRNIDRTSADAPGRFFSSRFQRVLDQRSWEAMMDADSRETARQP
jgi:ribonuclease HI